MPAYSSDVKNWSETPENTSNKVKKTVTGGEG